MLDRTDERNPPSRPTGDVGQLPCSGRWVGCQQSVTTEHTYMCKCYRYEVPQTSVKSQRIIVESPTKWSLGIYTTDTLSSPAFSCVFWVVDLVRRDCLHRGNWPGRGHRSQRGGRAAQPSFWFWVRGGGLRHTINWTLHLCPATDWPVTMASRCKKFEPNIFNKSKCQNCFRAKESHSAEALESSKVR